MIGFLFAGQFETDRRGVAATLDLFVELTDIILKFTDELLSMIDYCIVDAKSLLIELLILGIPSFSN